MHFYNQKHFALNLLNPLSFHCCCCCIAANFCLSNWHFSPEPSIMCVEQNQSGAFLSHMNCLYITPSSREQLPGFRGQSQMAHLKQLLCTKFCVILKIFADKIREFTSKFFALHLLIKNINPSSAHVAKFPLRARTKIHF